jgi:glycosyltransferase involved in cell wall biosynthesis
MRMAIYHPWVYLTSGIERSFVELISRSRHEWTIYTHHHDPDATFPQLAEHDVVELTPSISVRREFGAIARAAHRIRATTLPEGADALLVSSEGLGDLIMTRNHLPTAAYCHTPLKILHDPVNRAALIRKSPKHRLALAALGPMFSRVDRRMWERFNHVFANSEETRSRIERAGLAPSDDVEVLHPGVDTTHFALNRKPRRPMFLVAGRIMWQKNIELAIEALRRARDQGSQAELVVAGRVDAKSRGYLAELQTRAEGLPVRFEVDPTDEALLELYRTSRALLFTARNEDFGMVPLEAMACGTPVLAVDAGGPKETVVDGHTGWLLPDDAAVFADRMRFVELVEPEFMRVAARRRAEQFVWEPFVERVDDVMEALATSNAIPAPATRPTPISTRRAVAARSAAPLPLRPSSEELELEPVAEPSARR